MKKQAYSESCNGFGTCQCHMSHGVTKLHKPLVNQIMGCNPHPGVGHGLDVIMARE